MKFARVFLRSALAVMLGLAGYAMMTGCSGAQVVKAAQAVQVAAQVAKVVEAVAQPVPTPEAYTVAKGDTLWRLAYKKMGSSFLWPILWKVNRDQILDPDWIDVGASIDLPAGYTEDDMNWAVKLSNERSSKPESRSRK